MREPAVSAPLLLSKTGIRGADSSDAEQAEALLARYRGDSTWTPTLMMISRSMELADCHAAQRLNLFLHLHRGFHAFLLSQGR